MLPQLGQQVWESPTSIPAPQPLATPTDPHTQLEAVPEVLAPLLAQGNDSSSGQPVTMKMRAVFLLYDLRTERQRDVYNMTIPRSIFQHSAVDFAQLRLGAMVVDQFVSPRRTVESMD